MIHSIPATSHSPSLRCVHRPVVVAVTACPPAPDVIPLFVPAATPARPPSAAVTEPGARRGLPLPGVQSPRPPDAAVYGMAALDCHGRIADRAALDALGWPIGYRLSIQEADATLTLTADPAGSVRVIGRGQVRIPAVLRHRCGLATGDRVLLAADPIRSRLTIYPPAALDQALTPHSPASTTTNGGDPT